MGSIRRRKPNVETNNTNEHNMAKNPIWQEVEMLCIYRRFQGVELVYTEKQRQLSGQSGT